MPSPPPTPTDEFRLDARSVSPTLSDSAEERRMAATYTFDVLDGHTHELVYRPTRHG